MMLPCLTVNVTMWHINWILLVDVIDTTRIWDINPYSGMIRLQGGDFVNQGHVEVYCNGQWETICDNGFDSNDGNIISKQLGYTDIQIMTTCHCM